MKKGIKLVALAVVLLLLVGCNKSYSFTYKVSSGDNVKIDLNATGGYSFDSSLPFKINKDGSTLMQGEFITLDGYNMYKQLITSQSTYQVLDTGSIDNIEYVFYSTNSQYSYIIKINNSNTGLLLTSSVSKEAAEDVFDRLTFKKV